MSKKPDMTKIIKLVVDGKQRDKFYVTYEMHTYKLIDVADPKRRFGSSLGPHGGIKGYKNMGNQIGETEIVDDLSEYKALIQRLIDELRKNKRRKV